MFYPSLGTDAFIAILLICFNAVLLLSAPWRLWQLHRSPVKVRPSWLGRVKKTSVLIYALVEVALPLVRPIGGSLFSFVAILTSAVASLALCLLSWREHQRSVRPSDLIIGYLLASSICSMLSLTIPGLTPALIWPSLITQLVVKLATCIIECQSKEAILLENYQGFPPEEATSFLGRVFFWWVNPVLAEGFKNVLVGHQLPSTHQKLASGSLRRAILRKWDQRAKPENKATLPKVLLRCLLQPFIAVIIPRLFLTTFRYGQPVLIRRAIRFVTEATTSENSSVAGYWIIITAIIVYIGLAVSASVYRHGSNQLKVMIRGCLVGLIHSATLIGRDDDTQDGKIVTLMSNDVGALEDCAEMFHETWSQLLEVAIGVTLLAREVGRVWPLPLCFIAVSSRVSRYVANNLKSKQGLWNAATQNRMSVTSSVLGSIKTIKMTGLQDAVENHIQETRKSEMDAARSVRWIMFIYGVSANALGLLSPVLTVVLYAALQEWRGERLDTETAFTTVAILAMVTHPANMIMTIVPRAVASFSSFERIQAYLLNSSNEDVRLMNTEYRKPPAASNGIIQPHLAIRFDNVSLAYRSNPRIILKDINLHVTQGSVAICTGAVGAGKTTLARAILGELPPQSGKITVSSKTIGYCSQTSWLPNLTIENVIYGPIPEHTRDKPWYEQAIKLCCLEQDLKALPEGDRTLVGNKGMNLSGGQRQRVALARLVYARHDIVVLDDSFSGLDRKTEAEVVHNLLGSEGLFRKHQVTPLWITTATKHFHLADTVIVLGQSTIQDQGPWDSLKDQSSQITHLIHPEDGDSAADTVPLPQTSAKLPSNSTLTDASKDLSRKNGDLSLYEYYFKSAGLRNVLIMSACTASYSFFFTFTQYWLKWWTESATNHAVAFMVGYFCLMFAAWISTDGNMGFTGLRIAPISGIRLHNRLLRAIMGAPLSYFSGTQSGNILNRFGQDIQLVDKQLATATAGLSAQIWKLTMQATILIVVQYLLSITLPVCALIVYIVQKVYLRTSRQLRYLELESRSAVYSSFLETAQGIATIRAFGWQKEIADDNTKHLDDSQKPFYLLFCLQRWLSIVLDLLVAGLAIGTISLAVALRGSTTGGQVGVALNLIIVANTTLLSLVTYFTDLEIGLGAVARLKEVESDTPRESLHDAIETQGTVPDTWPSSGSVIFTRVKASYNPDILALNEVDLKIAAGQTAVICGRTGSGKSSLLLTLLRLLEVESGFIKVDGVDIRDIPHAFVRRRAFITVSQDVFLLRDASLRFNLDPYSEAPESLLVDLLRRTGLWSHFAHLEPPILEGVHNGTGDIIQEHAFKLLEQPLVALPSLSVGQSQLLSLTRSLVQIKIASGLPGSSVAYSDTPRGKPIVLLDEVTASLDPVTESNMYDIIEEEIINHGHTVIMVTHKLGAFAQRMRPEKDIVVWMKDGKVGKIGGAQDI